MTEHKQLNTGKDTKRKTLNKYLHVCTARGWATDWAAWQEFLGSTEITALESTANETLARAGGVKGKGKKGRGRGRG